MTTLGLVNIGVVATGVLAAPRLEAESIFVERGRIAAIGAASRTGAGRADVVVDCVGTTVVPGLIDSHCHVRVGRSRNTPMAKRLATFKGVSVAGAGH